MPCPSVKERDDRFYNSQVLFPWFALSNLPYSNLSEVFDDLDESQLKPFPPANTAKFASFLDKAMGLS